MSLLYIIKYYNKFGANITCQTVGGKTPTLNFAPAVVGVLPRGSILGQLALANEMESTWN